MRQQSKSEQKRRSDEQEISAYFKAARPKGKQWTSRQNHETHVRHEGGQAAPDGDRNSSRRRQDAVQSPVTLPEKPFLGFGSRGALPGSGNSPLHATKRFPTSDSLPQRSSPPLWRANRGAEQCYSGSAERTEHPTKVGSHRLRPSDIIGSQREQLHGTSVERALPLEALKRGSISRVSGHKSSLKDIRRSIAATVPHDPVSHVTPKLTHKGDGRSIEEDVQQQSDGGRSYRTSDILKLRAPLDDRQSEKLSHDRQSARITAANKESQWPSSASNLRKQWHQRENDEANIRGFLESEGPYHRAQASSTLLLEDQREFMSHARGQGQDDQTPNQMEQSQPSLPTRTLRPLNGRILHQTSGAPTEPQVSISTVRLWRPSSKQLTGPPSRADAAFGMHPKEQTSQLERQSLNEFASEDDDSQHTFDLASEDELPRPHSYEPFDGTFLEQRSRDVSVVVPSMSTRGPPTLYRPPSTALVASTTGTAGCMQGFWRANKLY